MTWTTVLSERYLQYILYQNHLFCLVLMHDDNVDNIPLCRRIRVVSNLPYNITTPCLQRLLPKSDLFSNLFFMIQDEVARRLCLRKPGASEYRAMTIVAQFFSNPQYLLKISKGVYHPQPKVDGALVDFAIKSENDAWASIDESAFVDMVKC